MTLMKRRFLMHFAFFPQECRNIEIILRIVPFHAALHRLERWRFMTRCRRRGRSCLIGRLRTREASPEQMPKAVRVLAMAADVFTAACVRCGIDLNPVAITVIFTSSFIFSSCTAPKMMFASSCAALWMMVRPRALRPASPNSSR